MWERLRNSEAPRTKEESVVDPDPDVSVLVPSSSSATQLAAAQAAPVNNCAKLFDSLGTGPTVHCGTLNPSLALRHSASSSRLLEGSARPLTEPGLPPGAEVDAVFSWRLNGKTCLIRGRQYWRFCLKHTQLTLPPPQQGSTLSALPWPALKSLGLSRQRGSAQLELWLQDLRSQRQDPEPPCASLSTSDRRGQRQFLPGQLSAGPRRARHLGTRLTRLLQGNRPPWRDPRVLASFKVLSHNLVDEFFDKMENEPEGAQMEAVLAETKEKFIKDAFKVMDNHIQENLPETLKESSPLLQEAQQEVRCRIQRRSVSTSLEVQNPEESIWARALRQFLGILQSFLSGCRDALTWLWEKAAACLQAVCSAVEALWEVLTDFCSFVGQLLCRSLIQV
ncbi:uncharacterized protein LOC133237984 [Bos javanicus]|uniref:uncharacterized protein LOC133237984 n=1 Tax=Bos javanicus TaxID=9906 RepID=UPI002AA8E1D9|nr:uncharacterized protein LOC133237984 [Bos javanicus]